MEPSLPPAQSEHPPVPDAIPGFHFHLKLDSLLDSPIPSNTGASTPAEQGVCDRTEWLSPTPYQASTPEGRQQQFQAQSAMHGTAKRQRCSGNTLTFATPTPPIFRTTPASASTFNDLPDHLQTIIFSYSAAPFTTCKNSAAVRQDAALLADWMSSNPCFDSVLVEAASLQLWDVCDVLIDRQRFDQSEYDLSFALHHAAVGGHVGTAQKLLQHGAWVSLLWSGASLDIDINICDCCGMPHDWPRDWPLDLLPLAEEDHPLVEAAGNGHAEMCSLLLQHGRHTAVVREAVYVAAACGRMPVLQVLLQEGPDVSESGLGRGPMVGAAHYGQLEVLELFLSLGADPLDGHDSPWSGSGYVTCLEAAATGGSTQAIEFLLSRGAALQPEWERVLLTATRKGHLNVIRLLLTKASEAAGTQHNGQPHPQQKHHRLHSKYAVLKKPTLPDWATIDTCLAYAAQNGDIAAALLLLHSGMEVTQEDLNIALVRATIKGGTDMMQLLLHYGAHVNRGASRFCQQAPLRYALTLRRWAAAECLLLGGAHANHRALMLAFKCDAPLHIIQLLLQRGAKDKDGKVILQAAKSGQQEVVHLLLRAQLQTAESTVLAGQMRAALCGAASQGRTELVQYLLSLPDDILSGPASAITDHNLKQTLSRALEAAVLGPRYNWESAERGVAVYMYRGRGVFTQAQAEIVSLLLQKGADPNYGEGKLLHIAVQKQLDTLLQLLLDAGAIATEPALQVAATCGATTHQAFVKMLSATKGPVDRNGAALATAAQFGNVTVVKMLLARGANVTAALQTVTACNDLTAAAILRDNLGSASQTGAC